MVRLSSVAIKYFFNLPGFRTKVATLDRIRRLLCSGLGGYFGADSVATLLRIRRLLWSGFGGYFAPEYALNTVYLFGDRVGIHSVIQV